MLIDILQAITRFFESFLSFFGLPGITFVAFLENLFPFTPSEYMYPLAGKLAHDTGVSPLLVILASLSGTLAGALCFYALGYRLGEDRVRSLIERYGRVCLFGVSLELISIEAYERAETLFERRGGLIVCVARMVPMVHGVISIPAGVMRMPLLPFLLYSALGASVNVTFMVMVGYLLGSNWDATLELLDIYEHIINVGLVAAIVGYIAYRVVRSRLRQRTSERSALRVRTVED